MTTRRSCHEARAAAAEREERAGRRCRAVPSPAKGGPSPGSLPLRAAVVPRGTRSVPLLLQDHPPLLLSRALMLLAGQWTGSGTVRWLDPALVLAEAWKPHRLARCRERLAAGEQAPPITVVGFRLGQRRTLYGVSDGMHRTVAHRDAGQKVKARIGGYYPVEPTRHVLWRDHLWRQDGEGLRMVGIEAVPDELRPILLALGVQVLPPPSPREDLGGDFDAVTGAAAG